MHVIEDDVIIHQATQTKGIMFLKRFRNRKWQNQLKCTNRTILSVGPRATYDTSATVHTEEESYRISS